MAKYIGQNSGLIVLMGQGAGRYPTASAVLRDLECVALGERSMLTVSCRRKDVDNSLCLCRYYVRLPAAFAAGLTLESAEYDGEYTRGVTAQMSVQAMHDFARRVRRAGGDIFFAEINAERNTL